MKFLKYVLAIICCIVFIPFALMFGVFVALFEFVSIEAELFETIAPGKEYMK